MREMERRAYRASTGRVFNLVRYEDPDARDPWPQSFWLYEWEDASRRWTSGTGYLTSRHTTPESAIERLESQERIRTATEGLAEMLSRAEYEAACQRAGIESWSDDEVRDAAYGIRYGEYTLPEYSVEHIIRISLARPRLATLEAEDGEKPVRTPAVGRTAVDDDTIAPAGTTPTRKSYGTGKCARCGAEHSYWNPGAAAYLCSRHWDDY